MTRRAPRSSRSLLPELALDSPWAISEAGARAIQSQLGEWRENPKAMTERYHALAVEAATKRTADPFADGPGYEMHDRVALIRFEGVVCKRLSFWGWLFGGSASTEVLQETLDNALNDAAVKSILLLVDSPGGTWRGIEEAGDAIYAARTKKAVWGVGSDCACSAAAFILAQCTKSYANAGGATLGSLGTIMSFADYSVSLAMAGVKMEHIRSAPLKGAPLWGEALTPEARAYLQKMIDDITVRFGAGIARGRGFSPEQLAAVLNGKCFLGEEAVTLGLVDGIATPASLIGPLQAEEPVVPDVQVAPVEAPADDDDDMEDTDAKSAGAAHVIAAALDTLTAANADLAAGRISLAHFTGLLEATAKIVPDVRTFYTTSTTLEPETKPVEAAAVAPKEKDMEKHEVEALIAAATEPLKATVAKLTTENEALKASHAEAATATAAMAQDRALDKLLAAARGELEDGGPVRIAAKDKLTQEHVRLIFETKGPEAAAAFVEKLPVIGKGKGLVTAGSARTPLAAGSGAKAAVECDFVGRAPSAYDPTSMPVHEAAIDFIRHNPPKPGLQRVSNYYDAVLASRRRDIATA